VPKLTESKIFFPKKKYTVIRHAVAVSLAVYDVFSNIPSGNIIIFDITATIIPMEIHLIQSNIQLSTLNLEENITPNNLQKYVAIDETKIARIIV
tara:strand:- start:101 stop:385 length:285 start_codon:yes stop_codon:yes gene_type:complete